MPFNYPHEVYLPPKGPERDRFLEQIAHWSVIDGWTQDQIGARIGCSPTTVGVWLRSMGIVSSAGAWKIPPVKDYARRKQFLGDIARMYETGLSIRQLAEVIGVQYAAARRYIILAGCELRPVGRNLPGQRKGK